MVISIIKISRCLIIIYLAMGFSAQSYPVYGADFGFSGMQVQGVDRVIANALSLQETAGVIVRDVALGGPADIAGIKRGDLITHFNDIEIVSFKRLVTVVMKTRPGQTVPVKVKRIRKTFEFSLKLILKPEAWSVNKREVISLTTIGLTMVSITPDIREKFNIPWGSTGVLVTMIDPEFSSRMLLRRGDIIVQVNQFDVWRPSQIEKHYIDAKAAGRSQLLILIERLDGFSYMMLPVK